MNGQMRSRKEKRFFLLHELPPMQPYVSRLLDDVAANGELQHDLGHRLARLLAAAPPTSDRNRKQYDLEEEVTRAEREQTLLEDECVHLGAQVGDGGEMLFPCSVDFKDAFFIWHRGEQAPIHWRFRDDADEERIPPTWYTLFQSRQAEPARR